MNKELKMKAIINREASKVLNTNYPNGNVGKRVLHTALVLDGPLTGAVVTCTRTLLNSEGVTKKGVEIDQEVVLHMTIQDDPEKGRKPFFSIDTGSSTSDEDIFAMLAEAEVVEEAL